MAKAIKAEQLSKAYQLGDFGTGTISRDLERFWARVRGKEDPFLKIGESNDRTVKGGSDIVWSLRDLDFEIEQGDAVGVIGRNGAGKSTLLKILSRVTSPTTGSVKIKGRIASLLEVGTGFHPELTGKENIFLNGAILGMRKAEIRRKFDEIVGFAGVERYIDTPVKRYSSGMYVRLAFAVAAHLESEILIVDEVLAVGDAEFQRKCLGKMSEVSRGEGRTVLFVSHNMGAVKKFCKKGLYLDKGRLRQFDTVERVIDNYALLSRVSQSAFDFPLPADKAALAAFALRLFTEDRAGNRVTEVRVGEYWQIRIVFRVTATIRHFIIALGISDSRDNHVRTAWSCPADIIPGDYEAVFTENSLLLATGTYSLSVGLSSYEKPVQYFEGAAHLQISEISAEDLDPSIIRTSGTGILLNPMEITIKPANTIS
ncbi:ABC transporter ATP-binding protein [Mucilaginibacter ginsenosidivorans]|uniref:ABC transporter ATP-binding protein n=1 Tax=Mucilaginibacter ginsenosidivorans TaxID=398053 RepID=A0A5B8UUH2_9SPHI|nr:ABC transporter ATP-binding protein [Mucilaginibacter ginsenosidivorans]QEC62559.1 ABC transporter ATP-binding protein [Mucilaginibacter ginsenosidivorans]